MVANLWEQWLAGFIEIGVFGFILWFGLKQIFNTKKEVDTAYWKAKKEILKIKEGSHGKK